MTQYFQSFVGEPLNSSPQGWVSPNAPVGGPNGKYRIALNSTRGINLLTVAYGVGSFGYTLYYPEISYKNPDIIEFFIKIDTTIISNYPSFLRFFFDTSYNTGIDIAISSTNFKLNKVINGISTTIVNYAYTFSNNSIYYIRARCNWPNRFVQAKVWDNDVTTEPISWHIESVVNDTGITIKGYSGIGYPGDGFWVHYIGIGTNGDSAPIGPVPFPEVKGVKTLEVPQKILREPRLLTPKKQPNWPVKVDKTNSLTKDLAFCMVPPNPVNIARSNRGYSIDTSLPPVGTGVGGTGLLWRGAGGIYGAHHGGGYVLTSASWSWFIMCNHTYTAEYAEILAFWNGVPFAASYTIKIGKYGGYLTAQSWGGADTNIVATSSLNGQLQSVGGQINSDVTNGSVIWFEGIKKTGTAKTITQSTLSGTASTTSFYYFPSASNIHRLPNLAELGVVYVWNRCISDEEMKSISLDPYQILAPA